MNNGERVYWKYYKNYTQKKNRLQIYSYFVTRFTDQRGFSGLETKKGKVKNHIPLRINFLFFFIFVLFSALVLRLGTVQIVQGEDYRNMVQKTDATLIRYPVPRGEIYDANYNLVVYNVPTKAIIYTPPKNPQPEQLYSLAKDLGKYLTMNNKDIENLKERELKDIWLLENKNGEQLLTDEEKQLYKDGKLSDRELYHRKLERITEEHLQQLDLNVAAIYKKLNSAVALTPANVKNENVSDEEYALISEHLYELEGIDVTTDWKRDRHFGDIFWNILGKSTTTEEGIPFEKADYYVAKGFALNDRVGKSYLEEMYDDILQGRKEVVQAETNKKGEVVNTELLVPGETGKDIVLTIDMEFQGKVEKILEEELLKTMRSSSTVNTAFVVAMDPKTGYILAMAGRQFDRESGEFHDFTPGTFTAAYEAGSAVKGATLLAGYQTGVRSIGEVDYDRTMYIKGSPPMSSWTNLGAVNDLRAIEQSSNVYMWKTAIEMLGGKYVPHQPLRIDPEKIDVVRYYFGQFGLGVPTGIGFPNETSGMKSDEIRTYHQIAIGQLDTYTPLQLAQYVSTIANGGYRMKPQLVKEIREHNPNGDGPGRLLQTVDPVVLNRVDMTDEMIERVQQGFWRVTHFGTGARHLRSESYNIAGKTGTAETSRKTYNLSFVGYAPYEDPEIAIAVLVPDAARQGSQTPSITFDITKRVMRTYFNLE